MVTLPDGRAVPPPHADEKTTLESWLDFHRGTLEFKVSGLKDDQVREAAAPPSRMTLLGLVQHLAEIERNWFRRILGGQDVPPVYGAANEGGFTLDPDRGIDEALAIWRAEVERSRELVAGAALDQPGRLSPMEAGFAGSETVSLRWILVHVIEEYARHNGHADLLRERIDGSTGP